jgi:3-hydroxyisobutyrate dehydrogenase
MVVSGDQAERLLFDAPADGGEGGGEGGGGLADRLPPAAIVAAGCTQPAAQAKRIGERLAAAGLRFLDAPVSGGTVGAEAGTLTIMAAGPATDFETAQPVLASLGDKIFHVGTEWGQGSLVKTINQLLCGCHIAVAAEALALGMRAGLDGAQMLQIFGGSAAASWMLGDRGPRMLEREPPVRSAVDIFVKDLGIVRDTAAGFGAPTPMAEEALALFQAVSAAGLGSADDSQVITTFLADPER